MGDMDMDHGDMMEKMGEMDHGAMMDDMKDKMEEKKEVMNAAASYIPYTASSFDTAKKEGKSAIFFYADWCPTCRKLEKTVTKGLTDLPEGSTVLKADYDTETALKKKYKILSQSTVVFFDKDGKEVFRKIDPSLAEFQKYLK